MNETIEDIIKCIRHENTPKYYPSQYGGGLVPNKMRDLAYRIEAAYEYEHERSRRVVRMASANGTPAPWRLNIETLEDACDRMNEEAEIGKPLRNCDVGTEEEQVGRFHSFCKTHQSGIYGMCSPQCPCKECSDMCHCLAKWSQMTYNEAEGVEHD